MDWVRDDPNNFKWRNGTVMTPEQFRRHQQTASNAPANPELREQLRRANATIQFESFELPLFPDRKTSHDLPQRDPNASAAPTEHGLVAAPDTVLEDAVLAPPSVPVVPPDDDEEDEELLYEI